MDQILDSYQQKGLSLGQHIMVNASAGSGKTTLIIERFLHCVQQGINPDKLLLLTFTRKAAAEMQARLYPRLFSAPFTAIDSVARFIADGRPLMIQTIDAFCSHIVRNHAHRIGMYIQEFNSSQYIHDRLEKLCTAYLAQQQAKPIVAALLDAVQHRNAEQYLTHSLLLPLAVSHFAPIQNWNQEKKLDRILAYIHQERARHYATIIASLEKMKNFHDTSDAAKSFLADCSELLSHNTDENTDERFLLLCERIWSENLSRHRAAPELKQLIVSLRGSPKSKHSPIAWYRLLQLYAVHNDELRSLCVLCDHFERYITAAKRRENLFSFSDIFLLATEILTQHPAVLQSALGQYEHIMVDEFQDNNREQFAFIQTLCGNDARASTENPEFHTPSRTLFCVGDEKQSIYGFRGANLQAYTDLYDAMFKQGGEHIRLLRNYRSTPFLISFFNTVFPRIFSNGEHSHEDVPQNHEDSAISVKNVQGKAAQSISYTPVEAVRSEDSFQKIVSIHVAPKSVDAHEHEAHWVAHSIKELLASGTSITNKGEARAIVPHDIALLFRKRTHINYFERALATSAIPFVNTFTKSVESEELYHLFIACIELLTFGQNKSAAYLTVLRSPLLMLSDEAIAAVFSQDLPVFYPAAASYIHNEKEQSLYSKACEHWEKLSKGIVSPRYVLDYIWYHWGFRCYVVEHAEHLLHHYDYLVSFITDTPAQSIAALHAYLYAKKQRRPSPGANTSSDFANAVQLLSVHAAKGLEFPVVYLVDAAAQSHSRSRSEIFFTHDSLGPILSPPSLLVQSAQNTSIPVAPVYLPADTRDALREDAEIRRLLYVALTRAQDALFVSASLPSIRKQGSSFLSLLCDALEFDLEKIEQEPKSPQDSSIFPAARMLAISPKSDDTTRTFKQAEASRELITAKIAPSDIHSPGIFSMANTVKTIDSHLLSAAIPHFMRFSVSKLPSKKQYITPYENPQSKASESPEQKKLLGSITHAVLEYGVRHPAQFSAATQAEKRTMVEKLILPRFAIEDLDAKTQKQLAPNALRYAQRFFESEFWKQYHNCVLASEESLLLGLPHDKPRFVLEGIIDLLIDPQRASTDNARFPLSDRSNSTGSTREALIIIDYKTDTEIQPEHHQPQLAAYCHMVELLYKRPCKAYLFYLQADKAPHHDRLVPVAPLENMEARLIKQINAATIQTVEK